jgi:hypothetical protein
MDDALVYPEALALREKLEISFGTAQRFRGIFGGIYRILVWQIKAPRGFPGKLWILFWAAR